MDAPKQPSLRRRFAQFSLRALLVLMLTSAILLGWVARAKRIGDQQADIVAQLQDQGVTWSGELNPSRRLIRSAWTQRVLGEHFFLNVTALHAARPETVTQLDIIRPFRTINKALLNDSRGVDNETLSILTKSPNLSTLYVGGTAITDQGVEYLKDSLQLQKFVAWSTDLTDASCVTLSELPIAELILRGTQVSDAGLQHLASSSRRHMLVELDVGETNVTAAAIPCLLQFRNLQRLVVRDIELSDEQLLQLTSLDRLKMIDVSRTGVSSTAVRTLQRQLPNCFIHHLDDNP